MNPTLAKAATAGIPVVLLNAGCDDADIAASAALTCVGQPEQLAGQAAGAYFKKLGATNVLCVIHQSGQNLLDRCNGIAQALGVGSAVQERQCAVEWAGLHRAEPVHAERGLEPAAGDRPGHLLPADAHRHQRGDGPQQRDRHGAGDERAGEQTEDRHVRPQLGRPAATSQSGKMAFAIDQQQYLQGYLPIVFLDLYKRKNGQTVGGGTTVASGPLVVTSSNIGKVAAAIAAGQD